MANYINFVKTTKSAYSGLENTDPSTLYMVNDTHEIYIGLDKLYQVSTEDLNTKQDKLNASTNITIDASNNISATDTTYTGGDNIDITNNVVTAKGYTWNNSVFSVAGSIQSSTGFFETSDARKKTVISDVSLTKAYNMLETCQAIIFTFNDDADQKEQIGLLAQQVQAYFPEMVQTLKDGTLTLDYSKLSVVLLCLLKDMNKRLQTLENR